MNNEDTVIDKLDEVIEHLCKLERLLSQSNDKTMVSNDKTMVFRFKGLDAISILELPKHLQTTAMILLKYGRATATQIANTSHKTRAVESGHLNQLVVIGKLKKERKGKKTYFMPILPTIGESM